MGLDFVNADAHWSYSGFGRFRVRVAKTLGFDLDEMVGFGGEVPWSTQGGDIQALLNHSDCDGDLDAVECAKVAPALRKLLEAWPDDLEHAYDKKQGLKLVEDMEHCAAHGETLEFC